MEVTKKVKELVYYFEGVKHPVKVIIFRYLNSNLLEEYKYGWMPQCYTQQIHEVGPNYGRPFAKTLEECEAIVDKYMKLVDVDTVLVSNQYYKG